MQVIILAGGKGSRLKPFTTNIPKPLVPIGEVPILEVVLRQLKYYGFTEVILAVNHLAELIMAFFGDGRKLGLKIKYFIEDAPLGTAGSLSAIKGLKNDFLVMNGDLLTTINFKNFFEYHTSCKNDATIATYKKEVKIDLGVLKIKNNDFNDYLEKPVYTFDVSMGIYAFNKRVIRDLETAGKIDMPDFIKNLKALGRKIKCYTDEYYWLDIGRVADYEHAVEIFKQRKKEFLPNG